MLTAEKTQPHCSEKAKLVVQVTTYLPESREVIEKRAVDFLIKGSGRWLRSHMFWAFANGLSVTLEVDARQSTFVNEAPDLTLQKYLPPA